MSFEELSELYVVRGKQHGNSGKRIFKLNKRITSVTFNKKIISNLSVTQISFIAKMAYCHIHENYSEICDDGQRSFPSKLLKETELFFDNADNLFFIFLSIAS